MVTKVLACLILQRPSDSKPPSCHESSTRINRGICQTSESDEELLLRIHNSVRCTKEDRHSQKFYRGLPFNWDAEEVYDTVNPFGDFRQIEYRSLWTLDITKDALLYTNRYKRCYIKLSTLCQRAPSFSDFQTLPTIESSCNLPVTYQGKPYWRPEIWIDERIRAYVHRILRDLQHQWRHICRNEYNFITLKVFAQAIIWLSTLRFDILEVIESRHGVCGSHVWVTELPKWKPFTSDIIYTGAGVFIVFCRSLQQGLATAQARLVPTAISNHSVASETSKQHVYLIWSAKHIVLCRASKGDDLETTAPEVLFNGGEDGIPSDVALDYVLWATAPARLLIPTPIQSLPIEIQDKILNTVSAGTVLSAKLGCMLGIGSIFSWKDGQTHIHLEETQTNRSLYSPVESQIWFGRHKSGLVYRARS